MSWRISLFLLLSGAGLSGACSSSDAASKHDTADGGQVDVNEDASAVSTNGTSTNSGQSQDGGNGSTNGDGGAQPDGSATDAGILGPPEPDPRCADAEPDAMEGSGDQDDPYLLCLPEHVALIDDPGYGLSAFYVLGDDIDVSDLEPALSTLGASGPTAFSGSLDGQRHSLSGLAMTLFQLLDDDARVSNLEMSGQGDASLAATQWGLLSGNNFGEVRNVHVDADFAVPSHAGLLIGNNEGLIENCSSSGTVNQGGGHIGGLVGVNRGTVRHSYSSAAVTGNARVGGLVGTLWAGLIEESYSVGAVEGSSFVGGLVGTLFNGEILNSYSAAASVTSAQAGGLVGLISMNGAVDKIAITNSYAASTVVGANAQGLVGFVDGGIEYTITSSYFLDTATGTEGAALSAAEMQMEASFTGWDFEAIWQFDAGISDYPSLRFQ